jgi:hypothetical protein
MLPRCFALLTLFALALPTFAADEPDPNAIRKAVTFYASFDDEVKGDVGGGQLTFDTRRLLGQSFPHCEGQERLRRRTRSGRCAAQQRPHLRTGERQLCL